jgi:hypothetical protein
MSFGPARSTTGGLRARLHSHCGAPDPSTSRFHGRRRPNPEVGWVGGGWANAKPVPTRTRNSRTTKNEGGKLLHARRRSAVDDACSPI